MTIKWNFFLKNWYENRVNLLFFLSSNMPSMTSRANQQYENLALIYTEFDNKTLYVFSRHENPTRHCSFNTKAWNVINHNYHDYISCFHGTCALVGTPFGVSKFDFVDNFLSKNSAQLQNCTSWNCWGVNLVHCSVLCIERNCKRLFL